MPPEKSAQRFIMHRRRMRSSRECGCMNESPTRSPLLGETCHLVNQSRIALHVIESRQAGCHILEGRMLGDISNNTVAVYPNLARLLSQAAQELLTIPGWHRSSPVS